MNRLFTRLLPAASRWAVVPTLLCAVVSAAPAAHAQFLETFNTTPNNTNPATFGNDTGGFFVTNPTGTSGVYQSDRSQVANFSTIVAPGFTNLTDTTLTFDLLNASDSGAVLRSDAGAANAVTLIVRPTTGDLYFIQRTGGSFVGSNLGNVSLAGKVNPGDNLRVTFSSSGNSFTASVASLSAPNTILQSTSYTFAPNTVSASGRAGLYQFGNGAPAQFDNVGINVASGGVNGPEPGTLSLLSMGLVSGTGVLGRKMVRRRSKAASQAS